MPVEAGGGGKDDLVHPIVETPWREHDGTPAELLAKVGAQLNAFAKGSEAYQYERRATEVYGLPLRPGEPHGPATRWDAPAQAAFDEARRAGNVRAAFFAFAVLATSLRRANNFGRLDELLEQAEPTLGPCPLFAHFTAMAEGAKGFNPDRALAEARRAIEVLGDHAGAQHTLALAILAQLDRGGDETRATALLEEARGAVDVAIRLDRDNARFHLTRAQVLRHLGRTEQARGELAIARQADKDADRDEVRRRLYDYELLLINASAEIDRKIGAMDKRVDERLAGVETRSAEIAGVIVGIVALAIGGISAAENQTTPEGAIAVLAAIAVLIFGGTLVLGLALGRRR